MKNSRVWSHFKMVNQTKCQCIHCRKIISKNGGTSNLIKHLSRKHQEFCVDLELRNPKISLENHPMLQDEEKIKDFIYMVQMNPVLHTKNNLKELTQYEKESPTTIWEEIASQFRITEHDCRRIWFILRRQYAFYFKTKDPEKCKYVHELSFLDEYFQRNQIKKIPMKIDDATINNYDLEDESKKVLISVPGICDTPIHQISVNKTELIVDENSTQDYEVLFEDYDPILVKNQAIEDCLEEESILPERHEWNNNQPRRTGFVDRYQQGNQRQRQPDRNEYRSESNRNNNRLLEDRYDLNDKMQNQNVERPKSQSSCPSPKRTKKSTDGMDEVDFFFEFLQRKLRKMPSDLCRQLQMKFMETIQEAEQRSRKQVDRIVETDTFE